MTSSASRSPGPRSSAPLFSATAAANDDAFTAQDWGLFLAISGIWGASFLLIDIGLDAFPPGFVTLVRVASGAATLRLLPGTGMRLDRADRIRMVALAVTWVAVPFTLFPLAEQHINSAITGLLNGGTPIFVAVVATVLVRQPPGRAQTVGIVVGFAGIAAISAPSLGDGSHAATGVVMVIAATVCYGFAINIAAPLQARYGSLPLMARMLTIATVCVLPFGVAELDEVRAEVGPAVAVVALGVVGTGLAFATMATLVGRVGSTRASFITYLVPVVSLVLGVVFRDDHVEAAALVGVGLVIVGALLASRRS